MTTTTTRPAPTAPQHSASTRHLVTQARRTWRRAGVRRRHRDELAAELADELSAAVAENRTVSDVVGDDASSTFRAWALERGVAGRSLRLGLLGPLALGAIALGSLVVIVLAVVTFTVPGAPHAHQVVTFAALFSAAVTSMVLAPLACWAALHRGGDPRAGSTARWMLPCLPAGALIALALGVLTAAIGGYEGEIVIPIIAVVIALVFLGAAAAARFLAIRYTRISS